MPFAAGRTEQIRQLLAAFDSDDEAHGDPPQVQSTADGGSSSVAPHGASSSRSSSSSTIKGKRGGTPHARGAAAAAGASKTSPSAEKSHTELAETRWQFLKRVQGGSYPTFDDDHPDPGCEYEVGVFGWWVDWGGGAVIISADSAKTPVHSSSGSNNNCAMDGAPSFQSTVLQQLLSCVLSPLLLLQCIQVLSYQQELNPTYYGDESEALKVGASAVL